MHNNSLHLWQHQHIFKIDKQQIEKKTLLVVIITFLMMISEIVVGWVTNSMAVYADGWHMGTHAFALGISLFAYIIARKHAESASFAFGTWKIEILGAYTSAIVLGLVAILMVYVSIERFSRPLSIHYNEALFVAAIGLGINVVCAIILNSGSNQHHHRHENEDNGHAHHNHDDLNLRSAYLHVIADALTSVLAISALLGAKYFDANWLDPFVGILGALLIARWSILLLRDSASILLDRENDSPVSREIREHIEADGDTKISDLHLWKVADGKYGCIIAVVTCRRYTIEEYKRRLREVHELAHITIEINQCNSLA